MSRKNITIVGAGLVGSLLAIYLKKRGHYITIYERRPDLRKTDILAGKSINLALSNRGWRPLAQVGLEDTLEKMIIPMKGRMIHDEAGQLSFQPYGQQGQAINSISRGGLNALLLATAEELGVKVLFKHKCLQVDFDRTTIIVEHDNKQQEIKSDLVFGTDGAFSTVRASMQKTDRFNYSQQFIPHGYKELSFPPDSSGDFAVEKNALHIWPRGNYMLIALPNLDGSFTVTLFMPFEGENSFANLLTDESVKNFFSAHFADALNLMPNLTEEFNANPAASLVTVRSYPWVTGNTTLLGDAAHAIVPFYGQGMISGFEDCYVLNQLLDLYKEDWPRVLAEFQQERKPDAEAIADLALQNFVEMRDRVADANFLTRKKIEARLQEHYPDRWIPQYSMVTFNENIRYSEALEKGRIQNKIMDKVMDRPGILTNWEHLDLQAIVDQLPGAD
jgi:kynurenine 3-monooxygenase